MTSSRRSRFYKILIGLALVFGIARWQWLRISEKDQLTGVAQIRELSPAGDRGSKSDRGNGFATSENGDVRPERWDPKSPGSCSIQKGTLDCRSCCSDDYAEGSESFRVCLESCSHKEANANER